MTNVLAHGALIGIDWGLTQLRAYCLGGEGRILERRESASGILAVKDRNFAGALRGLIGDWLTAGAGLPIFLCGMIGSRNGWCEAPYGSCPATLREVADRALTIDIGGRQASLIGGITFADEYGRQDVIRGEETQLFGVAGATDAQLIVTPGTHSKWAILSGSRIEQFRTYMTGELYAVLSQHSSLGWWMGNTKEASEDQESYREGVRASLEDPDPLHSLFTVRTRALFKDRPPEAHAAYLSGILIGSEVESGLRRHRQRNVSVIGAPNLTTLYRTAFSTAGIDHVTCIPGDEAVARGLWQIWKESVSR